MIVSSRNSLSHRKRISRISDCVNRKQLLILNTEKVLFVIVCVAWQAQQRDPHGDDTEQQGPLGHAGLCHTTQQEQVR